MNFNPKTYELEFDRDEIDEERRIFLINGGRLSLSALILAGFIPIDAEANPLLLFRVLAGPVIKYFSKKAVKRIVKRGVRTVNTVSAVNTLSGNMISSTARDILISKKAESTVNQKINQIEGSIPNSIWSQSGEHKYNDDSNKLSIVIANNTGRDQIVPTTDLVRLAGNGNKEEAKLKIKKSRVKQGITIVEVEMKKLPSVGAKRIVSVRHHVVVSRQKAPVVTSGQQIVIATDKEVNDIIRGRNTASKLYEKYVTNFDHRVKEKNQEHYQSPEGVGTNLYEKYIN